MLDYTEIVLKGCVELLSLLSVVNEIFNRTELRTAYRFKVLLAFTKLAICGPNLSEYC